MKSTIAAILKPPRGLNRALMTSSLAVRLRPALVTALTLATGSACILTALTPIFGLTSALLVITLSQLAVHAAAHFQTLGAQLKPAITPRTTHDKHDPAVIAFALDMAHHLLEPHLPKERILICPQTENYELVTFSDGSHSLKMSPTALTKLYHDEVEEHGYDIGTQRFAALHAYALMHEMGHKKQALTPKLAGLGLSLAGWAGLVTAAAASLSNTFAPGIAPLALSHVGVIQSVICAGAALCVMTTNAIQKRQDELDADLHAVRELGQSRGARCFFERLASRQIQHHVSLWNPKYPSPALRLASAEQLERQLPENVKEKARASFTDLAERTIRCHNTALRRSHNTSAQNSLAQVGQKTPQIQP